MRCVSVSRGIIFGEKGFSPRNLWDTRRLYETVADRSILRQVVAEFPWGHNLLLLNSLKDPCEREWYIRQHSGGTNRIWPWQR